MKISSYIKQRWYMLLAVILSGAFALSIYWAQGSPALLYALEGAGICVTVFIIVDFLMLRYRIKNMERFLRGEDGISFSYPLDKLYAKKTSDIIEKQTKIDEDLKTQHADEIEFITKWVHDVKIPISAIRLICDSLEEETAQQLEMQTLYIEQSIQKILFHIKSKSFYEDYTIKQADVKNIISMALKQFAVFFSYKKISLKFKCEDFKVSTDEKWCGYIISQIISNAVKYTPEGGSIEINAFTKDSKGIISIKNSGSGINEHTLKNIFKRGFSETSFRSDASTGYGLYLSKKLADIMGHKLYAESTKGESAVFILQCNVTKM